MDLKDRETSLEHWFQHPKVCIPMCNSPLNIGSGMINLEKSEYHPIGDVHNMEDFAKVLGLWVTGGAWCTKEMGERFGVRLCKAIGNGWEVFKDKTSLQVGLGNWVKFWNDRWCGKRLLRMCSRVFMLSLLLRMLGW
ncbi:hypothetical protein AAG906_007834 [Vitis piasezkii]